MYYFTYGITLSRKFMTGVCPNARAAFTATLPNHKLIFTGWSRQWHGGTASVKPFQGEKVIGGVYEISETDLRALDKFEGHPANCNRLNKMVITEDGDRIEAQVYIKLLQSEEAPPSREYLAIIQQGYRDWGIV